MMPMPAMSPTPSPAAAPHASCGGRLVAADGRELPLTATAIRGDARGGSARVVLEQRFDNPFEEPLRVTYQVPLPADGAVSSYAFRVGDRRVVGRVDRRGDARRRFEEAILDGRSAALLEQERADLFTQEVGNVPPGEAVVVEIGIDQPLVWLDEGAWEWRFPTVVAPRYLGAEGRVSDAGRMTVDVAGRALGVRASLALCIHDGTTSAPYSPSHALGIKTEGSTTDVLFRDEEGARLDRDVVVRWAVARPEVGAALAVARPRGGDAYGLLTLVPPEPDCRGTPVARDLIVLLDASGSMHGTPLAQAKRVVRALIDTLTRRDRLQMLSFATSVARWATKPVSMDRGGRERAHKWLASLRAGGGTEMQRGILEALAPLRKDAQRQVVLVTDGLIGFESEIVGEILDRLPPASRVHTVGVGSGVNRSLTRSAARAGRGKEVIVGIGEDAQRAARRLVAHTDAPLVVDLELSGDALLDHAPARLPDLFAGAPALVSLRLVAQGGALAVRGRTASGVWERRLEVAPAAGEAGDAAIAALYARERVEDLETRRAAHGPAAVDGEIERLGLEFSIATRLTSWVAVLAEPTVDPREPIRRARMPHELPYGMSAEGLGLRPAYGEAAAEPMLEACAMPLADDEQAQILFAIGPLDEQARPIRVEMGPEDEQAPEPGAEPGPDDAEALESTVLDYMAPEPPMPAAPEAPRRRRIVGGLMRSRPSPPAAGGGAPPPPAEAPPEPSVPWTPVILEGALVLQTDEQIVVEGTLDRDLRWSVPPEADLHFEEGIVTAPVDAGRSTRAGFVAAGSTLRIAVRHAGGLPYSVVFVLPGMTVLIRIR